MRHAKSSWAQPGARDFDRELNERGNMDLERLRNFVDKRNIQPEHIYCSSAERTRQTLDKFLDLITPAPQVTYTERLYSSGLDDYMALVKSSKGQESVMVVGHNPMCGNLAASLSGKGDQTLLDKIAYRYPTGTISVIEFDCETWADIEANMGELVDVIVPSEL